MLYNKLSMPKLVLADRGAKDLLITLHALLIAHKYDYAQSEQLAQLRLVTPGVEEYYEADDLALQPKALEVADNLLDLASSEVQEALYLGYLVGRVWDGKIDGRLSPEQKARLIVQRLGLEQLMEANLSFGYLPTEKATALLKETVAR